MLEERQCHVGGIPVRYRVAGVGPPIVFVHGLAGSWRWWESIVEPLAPRLRIFLVDLPGFGSARAGTFALAQAPSYIRALIAELGLERPHLVGHSLGGAVCARVAALWPDAVDRLVLVAPAGLLERRHPSQYALPIAMALRHAQPRFLRILIVDSLRAGLLSVYRAGKELLGDDALVAALASITAPTLLVWGERDSLVPLRLARAYQRALPKARLVVFQDVGHIPMVERARMTSRALCSTSYARAADVPGRAESGDVRHDGRRPNSRPTRASSASSA